MDKWEYAGTKKECKPSIEFKKADAIVGEPMGDPMGINKSNKVNLEIKKSKSWGLWK